MMEVKDFMTTDVVTVTPDAPLGAAAELLYSRRLNGLPVVDKERRLMGLITEYDLVTKDSELHLPTFMKLMKEFDLYRNDKTLIEDDLKKILTLKVSDVMNKDPLTLPPEGTMDAATRIFAEHHSVNPIPIVDKDHRLAGVLSRYDLIRLYGSMTAQSVATNASGRELDRQVDKFLGSFEKDFVLVTKTRTRYWLLVSGLFIIIGFAIAFAFIVSFTPRG